MISLPISQVLITAIMDNLPDAVVYFVPVFGDGTQKSLEDFGRLHRRQKSGQR